MSRPKSMPQWRSQAVFVSSTFRDMQAERDHLRNFVFPRLEERLRERQHHPEFVDLRQGVQTSAATSEAQREQLVLKVCLDEILRSRPFLIVLLGDRYGWVPPADRMVTATREVDFPTSLAGKSVTALEIEFGIFAESPPPAHRCLIYVRQPLPYDEMPEELRAAYSEHFSGDEQAPARRAALASLKQRLHDDPHLARRVRPYTATWDSERNAVVGLGEWGNQVFEDLWREMEEETRPFAARPTARWEEIEAAALAEFVEHRSRTFTGREEIIGRCLALARSPVDEDTPWGACITGPPGSGKSTLFARLARELDADPEVFVLANAAGATQFGSSVDAMLRRWIHQLSELLGVADPLPAAASRSEQVEETLLSLLGRCADTMRVAVLLDALDQFESTPRARYLTWLTSQTWPSNARLITTAAPGQEAELLAQRSGIATIPLPPLAADAAREAAKGVLLRCHVPWSDVVWRALAAKRLDDGHSAVGNPLWTTLACEQLALLDADDFDDSERRYVAEPDPQVRLEHLRHDLAERMPPDVPGLYEWHLARTEKHHGAGWTRAFAVAIALSRQGWREQDLRQLVPKLAAGLFSQPSAGDVDPLKLAELRRAFRAHLTVRGAAQQWDFSHAQTRQSVFDQFLGAPADLRAARAIVADHLHSLFADDPLRRSELMAHLLATDDLERAAAYYADRHTTGDAQGSADLALVEYVLSERTPTAAGPRERVVALLDAPGLPDDLRGRLCARVLGGFLDALQSTAPLALVTQLTSAIVQHCHTILAQQNRGFRYHGLLAQGEQRLARYLYESGDLAAAAEHSEVAVAMSLDHAREYPTSRTVTVGLTDALRRHANLLRLLGKPHRSRALLHQAESLVTAHTDSDIGPADLSSERVVNLTDVLSRLAPDRSEADRAAVDGYAERAALELEAGNVEQARALYGKAIALNDRLRALALQSRDFHEAVWTNYQQASGQQVHGEASSSAADDTAVPPADSTDALNEVEHFLNAEDLTDLRDGLLSPARRLVTDLDRGHSFLRRQAGYIEANHGDPEAAAAHFQEALEIVAELQARDPLNPELKTELMHAYRAMGAIRMKGRQDDAAAEFFARASALSEELSRLYPDNTTHGRHHAANSISLGQVSQQRGDLNAAYAHFQRAMTLIDSLRRRNPENRQLEAEHRDAELRSVTVREALAHRSRPVDLAARLRQALADPGNGANHGR